MICAFRSEWQKLLRPGMFVCAGIMMIAGALGSVIGISRAKANGLGDFTLGHLAQSDGFFTIMSRSTDLIALVALGVLATAVAQEYQHGTLRNLLVRQPDRLRLLGGKLAALTTWLAVSLALATSTALVAALIAAPFRGLSTSAWFTSSGLVSLFDAYGDTTLMGIGFGLVGAAVALLLRSSAPAIVGSFAWLLPLEALLVLAWSQLGAWLPGRVLGALGAGGTDVLPFTHALLGAGIWLAGLTAVAAVIFGRRDVAA